MAKPVVEADRSPRDFRCQECGRSLVHEGCERRYSPCSELERAKLRGAYVAALDRDRETYALLISDFPELIRARSTIPRSDE